MDQSKEIILTPRLLLRSMAPSDYKILHEHVFSDAAVMAGALSGQPMTTPQSREFVDRNFDHDGTGRKIGVLTERQSGQVIGFAGLLPCDVLGHPDYELGFVLRRSAWGNGYATEIGRGQIAFGFDILGLSRVIALVSPTNETSAHALRKIGMEFHSAIHVSKRGDRHVYVARRERRH